MVRRIQDDDAVISRAPGVDRPALREPEPGRRDGRAVRPSAAHLRASLPDRHGLPADRVRPRPARRGSEADHRVERHRHRRGRLPRRLRGPDVLPSLVQAPDRPDPGRLPPQVRRHPRGRRVPFRTPRSWRTAERDASRPMANRLAGETSPYLLQHANNPVDWFPWGPDALARAKLLDRPIFLSIGYAACHWCHVMERESFEHEATARYLNDRLRVDQGRSRGAPRPRPAVHGRRPGDDRRRRLADVGLPDPGRPAVLRRHLLPGRAAPRDAVVPPGPRGRRSRLARRPRRRSKGPGPGSSRRSSSSSASRSAPTTPTPALLETRRERAHGRRSTPATGAGAARRSSPSR